VVTFFATDSAGTIESLTTNNGGEVSSANPTITIQVDTVPPTVSCTPPAPAWQLSDVIVPCTASDNAGGSGLVGPASFNVTTNVPVGTETNAATIPAATVQDVAGNTSAPQGPFGPFEVDKKPPVIMGPTISPASPTFGQSVTANYSCTDGGSGVVLCGPSGTAPIPATGNTGSLSSPASGSVGSHTFTVNAQDAVGNQSVPSSVTYTVGLAAPTLMWSTPSAITYGTPLSATQLTATASVAGAFTYTPVAGTLLTAGTHTLSVTFTPTDITDYTTATATVLLVVNQAAPTISWATPAPITYGTALSALQLNAASNVAGTFIYHPAAGTVLNAGTQVLSTTFTPADATDYSTAIATVTLTVNQAASVISWATPAPIAYGTALSSTQLDATANVPGTFVYTPPAGTVLPAGSQTLAVAFTPTNAVDYKSATAQVTLLVIQPSIGLSPSSLNFGNVKYGNLVFLLETVSNPGSTPLKITGVSIKLGSGSDSDDFGFVSLCSEYLNPGKKCDIVVSFYADDLGVHDATLLVTDNAAGSPQQIPITANVVKK
jgi:hypothetical protein